MQGGHWLGRIGGGLARGSSADQKSAPPVAPETMDKARQMKEYMEQKYKMQAQFHRDRIERRISLEQKAAEVSRGDFRAPSSCAPPCGARPPSTASMTQGGRIWGGMGCVALGPCEPVGRGCFWAVCMAPGERSSLQLWAS